jgi:hypothetical protein
MLYFIVPAQVQFCALGGSTGQSEWSDPVNRMST